MYWARKPKDYNQRRAFELAGINPRAYRGRPESPADAELRPRMKELPPERRRFGYRPRHTLLQREGWQLNWKKLYRLYHEKGLSFGNGLDANVQRHQVPNDDPVAAKTEMVTRLHVGRAGERVTVPGAERDR